MRIGVAGGAGQIGQCVVKLLTSQGHDVMIADLKNGYDLREREMCDTFMKCNLDRIFHLADRTVSLGYSSTHHGRMMTDSLLISLNLLEAARKAGVKDYIYTSSSCVYPDGSLVATEDDGHNFTPESVNEGYSWAKRIAERQCVYYAREYGMRCVIARPANIYGPSYDWSRPIEDMHVIPSLICKMLRGDEEIVVWGSGEQTRTFQYAEDTAELIVKLGDRGMSGEAYNLGGVERPIKYLAALIAGMCDWNGKLTFDTSKPEGPKRKAQDISKISSLLSVELPGFNGLQETVEAARKATSCSA